MNNNEIILELSGVCKHYNIGTHVIEVLRGIDLQVTSGEWLSLTGASGSGKTTLLHLLGLLERPDEGKITACGQDYSLLKRRAAAAFRRQKLGFIFQNYCLLPELTVLENIQLPGMLAGVNRRQLEKDARELAGRVGLYKRLDHRSNELSGGEQQRAAIARALINRPAILLADEPTGNLDSRTGEEILQLFREIRSERPECTLIMITHNAEIAAMADRSLVLRDGVIRQEKEEME
ncbi:MAG: ABC transporter ATP-binding protein [Lentisphaeria bacterium]|nr:ABC transporter ATP-binding protein [Lentisphaeria bacterium]